MILEDRQQLPAPMLLSDGKSYLCRIFDMLHMGYVDVDKVLLGREVVEEMPRIVSERVTTDWLRSH